MKRLAAALLPVLALCAPPVSAACADGPRGLFVHAPNLPVERKHQAAIERDILHDPTVAGANIVVPWSAVDRGPDAVPRYDWRFVEEAVAPWRAAGKRIGFLVWGVAESSGHQFDGQSMTPRYVLDRVESAYDAARPQTPRTPAYWQPAYSDNYRRFAAAFIRRWGAEPWVAYIRFGIGYGAEDLVQNGYDKPPLREQWEALGLSEERWTRYTLDTLAYLASLHSPAPLLVTINNFSFDNRSGVNRLPAAVAGRAAQLGIGIGTQGLAKYDLAQEAEMRQGVAGPKGTANWIRLFDRHAGEVPLEVQTMAWSAPGGQGRIGRLAPLLALALRHHAQIVELYPAEWIVAHDLSHPAHEEYLQLLADTAAALECRAR